MNFRPITGIHLPHIKEKSLATSPHGYEAANGEAAKVLWVQTLKYSKWRRVRELRSSDK